MWLKTKLLVAGIPGIEDELRPLVLEGGEVEYGCECECVNDLSTWGQCWRQMVE